MSSNEPPEETPAEEPVSASQQEPPPEEDKAVDEELPRKGAGSVKWFSVTKGFGFIQPDEGGSELFVHQTSILADGFRSLREGERVEYDIEVSGDSRAKAINVTGPGGVPPQGAPRRVFSAAPYAAIPAYPAPYGGYMPFPLPRAGGRLGGRMPAGYPGRPPFMYGRGPFPPIERPPPPGTPGISSGFQVVVHNLPWAMTWQELKDTFMHTPGVVRADVIIDSAGRSRGFGTVRYSTREEALQAAEMMNNSEIGGRIVSVRIDRFA